MAEVTTIIRVHSLDCMKLLHRAVFSLSGQDIGVSVILMTQNFTSPDLALIEKQMRKMQFGSVESITVTNVVDESKSDLRSRLLNIGMKNARTRFIHFLDYDDIMYPDAYAKLTAALKRSTAAIAFGSIVSAYFDFISSAPFITHKAREFHGKDKYDLFRDNFCPLHSFVIDLSKVDLDSLTFDEGLTALEDYSFLLDVVSRYDSDFSTLKYDVGEYFRREDDSIRSADNEYPDLALKLSRLQQAREVIAIKKRNTSVEVRLSEFSWIKGMQSDSVTLANTLAVTMPPVFDGQKADLSPAISKMLCKTFYSQGTATPSAAGNIALIDRIAVVSQTLIVEGWINDTVLNIANYEVVLVTEDGRFSAAAERFERADVAEHFGIHNDDYGFSFILPNQTSAEARPNLSVYLIDEGGSPILSIPKIATLQ